MSNRGAYKPKRSRWPLMIFGLIGLNMTIVAITIVAATSDPSVATEPGYYDKAVRFDEVIRQRGENERLGWHTAVSVEAGTAGGPPRLRVMLSDKEGAALPGAAISVELFASVRAGNRQQVVLKAMDAGSVFEAPVAIDRAGAWIVRLRAQRATETFTRQVELLIPGAGN